MQGEAAATVGSLDEIRARGRVRGRLALFGPALVAAIACVDPGNVAANTQAGAETGYALVWVVVLSGLIAMLVQYLSAKLGLATGQNLPEVCGTTLSRMVPSLAVLTLGVPITDALVVSQAALSFGVPFALIALIRVTRRGEMMGSLVNRPVTTVVAGLAGGFVIVLNIGLLAGLFLR